MDESATASGENSDTRSSAITYRQVTAPEPAKFTTGAGSAFFSGRVTHWPRSQYRGEEDLALVRGLVDTELSEPYSIFTYRYFLQTWPQLCYLSFDGAKCFGTIVCKLDQHGEFLRGYIAMLVVEQPYRKLGIGSELVKQAVQEMKRNSADEVVLEAETHNYGALALYQNLGFIRDKRLHRYYLSGSDAFRLKLLLPLPPERIAAEQLSAMQLQAGGQPAATTTDAEALLNAAAAASSEAGAATAEAASEPASVSASA